jgi:hypothetical protein
MSILNFDGTSGRKSGKPFKVILGIGALAAVVAVASTLAANININSGPVEFGQGVAQTTACDDSITVTPQSRFINTANSETSTSQSVQVGAVDPDAFIVLPQYGYLFNPGMRFSLTYEDDSSEMDLVVTEVAPYDIVAESGPDNIYEFYEFLEGYTEAYRVVVDRSIFGFWTLARANVGGSGFQFSGVDVSGIDATEGKCLGKTFTLKAYGETSTAALASYSVFVGGSGFLSSDGSIDSTNPGTSSSGFSLEFTSTRISANSVYKITIESSDYGQTFLDGRTFNLSQFGLLVTGIMQESPTAVSAQCSNGVCTADYFRGDFQGGPGGVVSLVLEMNPSGTADKKWALTTNFEGENPYVTYGFIKYFNGTFGLFQITEDEFGEIPSEEQFQALFSTRASLPLTVIGQPEGTLTWSYPSESRYTE